MPDDYGAAKNGKQLEIPHKTKGGGQRIVRTKLTFTRVVSKAMEKWNEKNGVSWDYIGNVMEGYLLKVGSIVLENLLQTAFALNMLMMTQLGLRVVEQFHIVNKTFFSSNCSFVFTQ